MQLIKSPIDSDKSDLLKSSMKFDKTVLQGNLSLPVRKA